MSVRVPEPSLIERLRSGRSPFSDPPNGHHPGEQRGFVAIHELLVHRAVEPFGVGVPRRHSGAGASLRANPFAVGGEHCMHGEEEYGPVGPPRGGSEDRRGPEAAPEAVAVSRNTPYARRKRYREGGEGGRRTIRRCGAPAPHLSVAAGDGCGNLPSGSILASAGAIHFLQRTMPRQQVRSCVRNSR